MKAGFLTQPGQIELREVDVPTPGKGEVVARVHTALTCGTDLEIYRRGNPNIKLPSLFGNEFQRIMIGDKQKKMRYLFGLNQKGFNSHLLILHKHRKAKL